MLMIFNFFFCFFFSFGLIFEKTESRILQEFRW